MQFNLQLKVLVIKLITGKKKENESNHFLSLQDYVSYIVYIKN